MSTVAKPRPVLASMTYALTPEALRAVQRLAFHFSLHQSRVVDLAVAHLSSDLRRKRVKVEDFDDISGRELRVQSFRLAEETVRTVELLRGRLGSKLRVLSASILHLADDVDDGRVLGVGLVMGSP